MRSGNFRLPTIHPQFRPSVPSNPCLDSFPLADDLPLNDRDQV
jgi:hypothetical protein